MSTWKTRNRPKTSAQKPDISNSNLAIKKPADDEVDDGGGKDNKSQILPNFEINCLRTLPNHTPHASSTARQPHILKGFSPGSQLMQNSINFCRMKFYANQK